MYGVTKLMAMFMSYSPEEKSRKNKKLVKPHRPIAAEYGASVVLSDDVVNRQCVILDTTACFSFLIGFDPRMPCNYARIFDV